MRSRAASTASPGTAERTTVGWRQDGVYKARVDLDDADRTITLPNEIPLDTVPPRIVGASPRLSKDELTVFYRLSEPARGLLFVGGRRVVKTNSHKLRWKMAGAARVPAAARA